jgi:hypothetical protein
MRVDSGTGTYGVMIDIQLGMVTVFRQIIEVFYINHYDHAHDNFDTQYFMQRGERFRDLGHWEY